MVAALEMSPLVQPALAQRDEAVRAEVAECTPGLGSGKSGVRPQGDGEGSKSLLPCLRVGVPPDHNTLAKKLKAHGLGLVQILSQGQERSEGKVLDPSIMLGTRTFSSHMGYQCLVHTKLLLSPW